MKPFWAGSLIQLELSIWIETKQGLSGVWWEVVVLERAALVQARGQVGLGTGGSHQRGEERGGKQWNLENLATDLEM